MPKNWTNSRKESSAGIIATRFWVESACGKSTRGRAGPNGRSFRKETEYYAALLSQTRRGRLAGLEKVGRRTPAHQAREKRNARGRRVPRATESAPGSYFDQPAAAR